MGHDLHRSGEGGRELRQALQVEIEVAVVSERMLCRHEARQHVVNCHQLVDRIVVPEEGFAGDLLIECPGKNIQGQPVLWRHVERLESGQFRPVAPRQLERSLRPGHRRNIQSTKIIGLAFGPPERGGHRLRARRASLLVHPRKKRLHCFRRGGCRCGRRALGIDGGAGSGTAQQQKRCQRQSGDSVHGH